MCQSNSAKNFTAFCRHGHNILSYIRTQPGPDGARHNPRPGDLILAEVHSITALSHVAFSPQLCAMLGGTPAVSYPAMAGPAEHNSILGQGENP